MKSQLNLRVQKFLEGETLDRGAIVQVRSLTESGNSSFTQRLPVPVGDDDSRHYSLPVDPGTYEVSTMLPSGESVTRVLDVTGADEIIDATLDGGKSPHEWLSWQQWSGNLKSSPLSQAEGSGLKSLTILEGVARDPDAEVSLFRVPAHTGESGKNIWNEVSDRLSELDTGEAIDVSKLLPANAVEVGISQLSEPPDVVVHLPIGQPSGSDRAYLVVTVHDRSMLCVMPWPWRRGSDHKEVLVEALIAGVSDAFDGSPWSVRTTVRDEIFAGLLGYFSAGEQGIARELIGPARKLLHDKMDNPLAAAAGAYILAGHWITESAKGERQHDWMSWVKNLSQYYPWLPDGAILEGWLALRMRGREPQFNEARAALLEAERRGIPVYSAGVRRLADGLMLVTGEAQRQGETDHEAEKALGRVRRLAWQIDPGQPFTCIRLWNS